MVKFWQLPGRMTLALLIAASLLVFSRYSLLSFLIFIWLIGQRVPTPSRFKVSSAVWAYVYFSLALISLYSVAWLAHLSVGPTTVLVLLAIFSWALCLCKKELPSGQSAMYSGLSVGAAVLVCVFVSLPILLHPTSANVLRYAAKTGDDINHLAMIEVDRSQNGFVYEAAQSASRFVEPGFNTYPQGWHMNGAFFESQIVKLLHADTARTRVVSFYLYKTLWLGLAVFIACELMLTAGWFFGAKLGKQFALWTFLAGLALGCTLLVAIFGYGFQSFIAAMVMLCAGLSFGLAYISNRAQRNFYIVMLAGAGMASSSVWLLTAPMLLLPALYFVAKNLRKKSPYLTDLNWPAVCGAAVLMLLSLIPLYARLHYGNNAGSQLNAGGAVPPIWWLSVVLVWAFSFWAAARLSFNKAKVVLPLVAISFLEFLAFAVYQQVSFGAQHYYSIKITYLAALAGAALGWPVFIQWIARLKIKPAAQAAALLALLLAFPFLLGLDVRKSAYPLKDSAPISGRVAQIVLANSSQQKPLVILSNDPSESYLATKVAADVWVYGNPQQQAVETRLLKAVSSPAGWTQLNNQLHASPGNFIIKH